MAGDGGVFDGGVSRARFLKLAGLGAGLSLFPGSLFSANAAGAQAAGRPEILTDARYPIAAWWPPPPVENTGTREAQQASTNVLYADLAGAGFNVAIGGNGVGNERANRLALTACEDNDLRLVLADADLSNAIEGTATAAQGAQAEGQEEPEGVLQTLTKQDSRQDLQAQAAANRSTITQRLQEIYSGIEGRPGFGERPGLAGILLYVNRSPKKPATTRLTVSSTVASVERFDPSFGETDEGAFVQQPLPVGPPRFFTASSDAGRANLYRLRTT